MYRDYKFIVYDYRLTVVKTHLGFLFGSVNLTTKMSKSLSGGNLTQSLFTWDH
jgi:hypothetical protein